MTENILSEQEAQEIMRSLLHKEDNWVEWGKKCQKLQKSGYSSQVIFEQTGFQAIQQNLVIVAAQVYNSLMESNADAETLNYFLGPRSDILYEFRILNQEQRLAAAKLAQEKKIDLDGAKEIAKAIQEFSHLAQIPAGFSTDAGDAVAYQYWKRAKQKKDLAARTRLIAQALKFVSSTTGRETVEKLLSDFTVTPTRIAPLIPIYRLEVEEELPRIVPVVGSFPITKAELIEVENIVSQEPFRTIAVNQKGIFVPIPGWPIVLKAIDPVAIFSQSDLLPKPLPGKTEELIILVDRAKQEWDINSYFLVEIDDNLAMQWFEKQPTIPVIAQVILVLRPKKILDENNILEPWQMDD